MLAAAGPGAAAVGFAAFRVGATVRSGCSIAYGSPAAGGRPFAAVDCTAATPYRMTVATVAASELASAGASAPEGAAGESATVTLRHDFILSAASPPLCRRGTARGDISILATTGGMLGLDQGGNIG
jgi:hypothetical protein